MKDELKTIGATEYDDIVNAIDDLNKTLKTLVVIESYRFMIEAANLRLTHNISPGHLSDRIKDIAQDVDSIVNEMKQ
jgi:hypothetical protein